MARTSFFRMVLRKSSKITTNKPIFSQNSISYNYEYFLFQCAFWSLFNQQQRSQSNQEQCSLCCSSPCFLVLLCTHYGPLWCFSTYFGKLKEIVVLRPIFQTSLFLVTMAWLINYFAIIGNLLCDQIIMYLEKLWEQKWWRNENFKAAIRFGGYIFLRWYLKRKILKEEEKLQT